MFDDRYNETPTKWDIIGWTLAFIGFINLLLFGFKYIILGVEWLLTFI